MILAASDVSTLQQFLLDAAKRYIVPRTDSIDDASDLLASAAALDYVMLFSSERGDETLDDASVVAGSIRETLARAAGAALNFIRTIVTNADDVCADFSARHVVAGGIFDALRSLHDRGALRDDDIAFRLLTITSDFLERTAGEA